MTNKNQSTALVTTPKLHAPAVVNSTHVATVKLVDDKTILEDKEDVRLKLPDILGRVLARIWIDKSFKNSFKSNPKEVLNDNGVFLPDDMILEFQKPNSDRPRIVVYEQKLGSKFKLRVLYLQLVMMAGS